MKKNVLIFPCGTEIGLEINRALAHSIHFEMFGASSVADHGKFVYKNHIEGIPFVDDKNFIDVLNSIIAEFNIDFIVPAHDSVVLKLAQNADNINAKIITSPLETCQIARSKIKTYQALKNIIDVPKFYQITDLDVEFPVFVKPNIGQGSKGAKKINTRDELELACKKNNDLVICEYLCGEEYTIDCFTNQKGELVFSQGRVRNRISNGIAVNSKPVYDHRFQDIASKINSALSFKGMWFYQLKENQNGDLILLEIAPRIAGTMGLYRGLGINFVQLALFDAMGYNTDLILNKFDIELDRAFFARYKLDIDYEYAYMDFDDTILLNNSINTDAVKFIYQALNQNKKIILITKHQADIYKTLQDYRLDKNLFFEIIALGKDEKKSDYIKYASAIFIDDSFAERKQVLETKQIPVFSIDAIETLIDYKK